MADIAPLSPLRYDLSKVDLARVVAPPYDVISPDERAAFAANDPNNVVELILPAGEGDAKYAHAAEVFAALQKDGILVRDEKPGFYRYAQTFTLPRAALLGGVPTAAGTTVTRTGFLGLVRIAPYADRVVLPHERTLSGPKEDRLKLFRATQTNLSPGFMLYRDPERSLEAPIATGKEIARFTAPDGVVHALAKIDDPAAMRAITEKIAACSLLIADGHHRYETSLRYSGEAAEANPGASSRAAFRYFMVFFANEDDPNLVVYPTHRHVHGLANFDYAALLDGAKALFDVEPLPRGTSAEVAETRLAKTTHGLVVADGTGEIALLSLKAGADLAKHPQLGPLPQALRETDVAVLHGALIEGVLGITKEAQAAKTNLWYPQDGEAALRDLRGGKGQALFLMNATPVSEVRAVAEAGDVMPQKSTFFYPKVWTGLTIHTLEASREVATV